MRVGVFGTGVVGETLAAKIAELGHEVMVGTRNVETAVARTEPGMTGGQAFSEWVSQHPDVKVGTFAEAAAHGELLFNATNGQGSIPALEAAGAENLAGKILVDVTNALDSSSGMPPSLFVSNTDSLAEQIQRAFPEARVVKSLNTVNASLMVDPNQVAGGDHTAFVSGDDPAAKDEVTRLLQEWFGWKHVVDIGDVTSARGPEMYLALWLRLWIGLQNPMVTVKVVT
jgi:predicted dinucleotide-binding enzyme